MYKRCLQGWETQAHKMVTVRLNIVSNKLRGLDFKMLHVSALKLYSTTTGSFVTQDPLPSITLIHSFPAIKSHTTGFPQRFCDKI